MKQDIVAYIIEEMKNPLRFLRVCLWAELKNLNGVVAWMRWVWSISKSKSLNQVLILLF
jgi:hypothetical protein